MNFPPLSSIQSQFFLAQYDGTAPISSWQGDQTEIDFGGAKWRIVSNVEERSQGDWEWRLRFEIVAGNALLCGAGMAFDFPDWSVENYVLMPAAAYNGNRFRAHNSHRWSNYPDFGPNMDIVISPQERLDIGDGASRIDFKAGDLSWPAIAIQNAAKNRGFLVSTTQKPRSFGASEVGDYGISLEENAARTSAQLRISAPCVRPGTRGQIRGDAGHNWQTGDAIEIVLQVFCFDSPSVSTLFEEVFARRAALFPASEMKAEIPLGACWEIQQKKYNEQNWVEESGYYSVGMRECASQDWQSAWVGGLNALYPLLVAGDAQTVARAKRTFDFMGTGRFATGFFRDVFHNGNWWNSGTLLMRYNADALYFWLKSLMLLEARGEEIPQRWKDWARGCVDAFWDLWEKNGEWGHRINGETGEILWGGTCSASTAPGALILAARYFDEPRFGDLARRGARHFAQNYLARGLTNAGPGDALQCPDSESAAGLLESYTTLWEETGETEWLEAARQAAFHVATWTMPYDFDFPATSTFGKLEMKTRGTVWANIQNKHSAPGICSLSGISLLKLFRATGDTRFLTLLRDIAHAIPQYMSRADRPIRDIRPDVLWPVMAPGWVNERVNTSDWEVRGDPNQIGVGEIFGGSTWSEVALMLTWAEVPGIYWQTDTGILAVFDNLEARIVDGELEIFNPTKFDTTTKIWAETREQSGQTAGVLPPIEAIQIKAGERKRWSLV